MDLDICSIDSNDLGGNSHIQMVKFWRGFRHVIGVFDCTYGFCPTFSFILFFLFFLYELF